MPPWPRGHAVEGIWHDGRPFMRADQATCARQIPGQSWDRTSQAEHPPTQLRVLRRQLAIGLDRAHATRRPLKMKA